MKQLFIATFILLLATGTATAQSSINDTSRMAYYFYPSENIYQNIQNNNYIYYDSTGNKWESALVLPKKINLGKSKRSTVYHNGADVWMDNPAHVKKYNAPVTVTPGN